MDARGVDCDISYHEDGLYTICFGTACWTVYVDGLESPYSLTYRVSNNNDPMFGQNVDAVLEWYDYDMK
ncbi:hypothetical protein PEX1_079450 [Penicillium expansum]|uniref:Uncharacterized protein n=1 Tax=Penicillium expansum TaxID=27334 RepID=A0A0A2J5M0_PENEN|nr:hypothetical protein PEX2_055720 [Penicillium expansum]KGO44441.1 hypothetical protein PEXP_001320 [Penicillium expansum]KGO50081.1 hypothetical protein PEX2_055720 [Penicillium expansum]KGO65596.1 hypothetical protein PEX1_079450 [Penicillium expansum]